MYTLKCMGCQNLYDSENSWAQCPNCGSSGKELSASDYYTLKCMGCQMIYRSENSWAQCPNCGSSGNPQ